MWHQFQYDMSAMQQQMQRGMAQMQLDMQNNFTLMQRDMMAGAIQMNDDMLRLQGDMQRMQANMQQNAQRAAVDTNLMHQDLTRAQADLQRSARQASRDLHRLARQQHATARRAVRRAVPHARWVPHDGYRFGQDWSSDDVQSNDVMPVEASRAGMSMTSGGGPHSSGVSTSVINGNVYVNGQFVTQVPPGTQVSLETTRHVVRLNGRVIWPPPPPQAHAQLELQAGTDVLSFYQHGLNQEVADALRYSVVGICEVEREELCPICLDRIEVGQHTRTLPCFHFLHRRCAEVHFSRQRLSSGPVQCPICREVVGPTQVSLDSD
eukprot:TRINITY_DN2442_c0_g1_i1.p1 TRINITY_DN2442_c0_g1~~TRINITY_DN2442_c0_g1_i1.p1  ORF type:complete len:322 (-),score=41.42 TRINITY_DN2442_c0_g1_i1:224-1189(-)